MLLSLVDILRCPAVHAESALVLSVDEWDGTRIRRGTLGCPTCHARFAIAESVVDFRTASRMERGDTPVYAAVPDDADRLQAQLGLSDGGGVVLLAGEYARAAVLLAAAADVTILTVDAPAVHANSVALLTGDRLPFAAGTIRAAAVGPAKTAGAFLAEVARVLRRGGRLVAPAGATPPDGVEVMVKDDLEWVGEAAAPTTQDIITLRRPAPR